MKFVIIYFQVNNPDRPDICVRAFKKNVHLLFCTNYIVILFIIIYNNIYIQFTLHNLYILSDEDYA